MTVVTWAMLPKSQIDNETIEQAIERLIIAHEENPNSHLGVGESIDVHRKTEIVDHLAGSVLNDKFTMKEFSYSTDFKDLINYETFGWTSVDLFSLILETDFGDNNKSFAYLQFYRPSPYLDTRKDLLIQFVSQVDQSNTNGKIYLGLNTTNTITGNEFIGFERINGVTKAIVKTDTSTISSSAISVDMANPHLYRVQYIHGQLKYYFYIDGQIVAEISKTNGDIITEGGPFFYSEVTATNDGLVYIQDVFVSKSLI
jgi:hypothetical protein